MTFEEELLVRTGHAFAYPETPALGPGVLKAIQESTRRPRGANVSGALVTRGLWAAGIAVAVTVAVVVAWRDAREAVAEFLGLAVEGGQIRILPTPAPGAASTALPPERALESYATPTTLLAARDRLRFDLQLAPMEGAPIGVYTIDYAGTPVGVLDYGRFTLWEVREVVIDKGVFDKSLPPPTGTPYPRGPGIFEKGLFDKGTQRLAETTVHGRPAYWISGGPHFVRFLGHDGTPVAGSERTVSRHTLVWRGPGGTNYRLEIDGALEEALAIANSLP